MVTMRLSTSTAKSKQLSSSSQAVNEFTYTMRTSTMHTTPTTTAPTLMNRMAFRAIGVKEFFPYFDGEKTLDECIAEVKKATRNYVKRQMTFFLHQFDIKWIKGEEDVLEAISHE